MGGDPESSILVLVPPASGAFDSLLVHGAETEGGWRQRPTCRPHAGTRGYQTLAAGPLQRTLLTWVVRRAAGAVQVTEDPAVKGTVVELLDPGCCLELRCDAPYRYLTLHLEHVHSYTGVELDLRTADGAQRSILCGNNQSVVRIRDGECSAPLALQPGWNHVTLDLADLVPRAFGVEHHTLQAVLVHARCRLWHVFLHNRPVLDPELPSSVRVVQ